MRVWRVPAVSPSGEQELSENYDQVRFAVPTEEPADVPVAEASRGLFPMDQPPTQMMSVLPDGTKTGAAYPVPVPITPERAVPPPTPVIGITQVPTAPPGTPAVRPGVSRDRISRVGPVAASMVGVLLAVGLVTAFVLRDGAAACAAPAARIPAAPVALVLPQAVDAPPLPTSFSAGKVTFYGPGSTAGACASASVPDTRYTVALGPTEYAAGAACNSYIDLKGVRGTVRAKVTNLCPECAPGHLDLSDEAFAALDDPAKGIAQVRYRAVRNPDVGRLAVGVKGGSNPWWLALRIDNHGNPLRSVEVSSAGQGFESLQLQDYGYWIDSNGAGEGPFTVRVTDVLGHRATVRGIRLRPDSVQRTRTQLYGSGATAPAEPAPEPSPGPRPGTSRPASTSAAPRTPATGAAGRVRAAAATAAPATTTAAPPSPAAATSSTAPPPSSAAARAAAAAPGAVLTAAPDDTGC